MSTPKQPQTPQAFCPDCGTKLTPKFSLRSPIGGGTPILVRVACPKCGRRGTFTRSAIASSILGRVSPSKPPSKKPKIQEIVQTMFAQVKKVRRFKSLADYQKWLAYGHMRTRSGKLKKKGQRSVFQATPGHQEVSIAGKPHKVAHGKRSRSKHHKE